MRCVQANAKPGLTKQPDSISGMEASVDLSDVGEQPLIWNEICTRLPVAEQDEAKYVIGADLVDQTQVRWLCIEQALVWSPVGDCDGRDSRRTFNKKSTHYWTC